MSDHGTDRDDWLWDRSGEPDPDLQRLENLLGGFGLNSAY